MHHAQQVHQVDGAADPWPDHVTSVARCPSALAALRVPPKSGHAGSLAKLTIFQGAKRGANGGRHRATYGDGLRRTTQPSGSSGDSPRCPATVRSRLTSEGFVGSNPTAPTSREEQQRRCLTCGNAVGHRLFLPAGYGFSRLTAAGFAQYVLKRSASSPLSSAALDGGPDRPPSVSCCDPTGDLRQISAT
jgi:hypothetical protein